MMASSGPRAPGSGGGNPQNFRWEGFAREKHLFNLASQEASKIRQKLEDEKKWGREDGKVGTTVLKSGSGDHLNGKKNIAEGLKDTVNKVTNWN